MHRIFLAVLTAVAMLAIAIGAQAQNARQMRAQVEATMLVTGHVDIDRSGHVVAHMLDQPDQLPDYVTELVGRAVPAWRFAPVVEDGEPVLARAKMSLRLVATPAENGDMHIVIRGAHFGEAADSADASQTAVRHKRMTPPRYPENLLQIGAQGTVYLLLRIGRDGRVADAVAEQVNLTVISDAREMAAIRNGFSRSAIRAAQDWTFDVSAATSTQDYWVLRVPVQYALHDMPVAGYGQWSAYHPGPRERPEWARPMPEGFSPDTLIAGSIEPETSRFQLLNAPGG